MKIPNITIQQLLDSWRSSETDIDNQAIYESKLHNWLMLEKKKEKLASLREKAFKAQRNGDLRMAGKYLHEAEILETSIIETGDQKDER